MNTTKQEVEIRPEKKNSGLYGIWTHDLCDTSAVRSTNWANKPTGSWSLCWIQINLPKKL